MAYNLSDRFPTNKQSYRLLDPGSYQNTNSLQIKPNKVPFLSKTPRNTQAQHKIWTHAIYNGDVRPHVTDCTTISSKTPRFPYEKTNIENLEPLICQCEIENPCECSDNKAKKDDQEDIKCHTKIRRRLFKGLTPHSVLGEGLSAPSRKDYGFTILPNGAKVRRFKPPKEDCPPFYNTTAIESNAFYRGCKWSRWTSKRNNIGMSNKQTPGPADYKIDEKQSYYEMTCGEKLRALRRKTSKQLRYIEKIQRQNILEALPGPANYSPALPTGTNLRCVGPKAERFIFSKCDETPTSTTYYIKRDFDVNKSILKPCLANLPSRAPFAVKALRFKYRCEVGPSPNSCTLKNTLCQIKHCNIAPFGSCSKRFADKYEKDTPKYEDYIESDTIKKQQTKPNQLPTWEFRSKTIRMKPLVKMNNGTRPADLTLSRVSTPKRLLRFQYICPFFSSQARFQNWFNWIPVHGREKTPGPASYDLEQRTCLCTIKNGPMSFSERFTPYTSQIPAPNTYNVDRGLEDILTTHNEKLRNNVKNTHKYTWKAPVEQRKLSLDELEVLLLNKSIALLDVPDIFEYTKTENEKTVSPKTAVKTKNPKLLRCYIYAKKVKHYF